MNIYKSIHNRIILSDNPLDYAVRNDCVNPDDILTQHISGVRIAPTNDMALCIAQCARHLSGTAAAPARAQPAPTECNLHLPRYRYFYTLAADRIVLSCHPLTYATVPGMPDMLDLNKLTQTDSAQICIVANMSEAVLVRNVCREPKTSTAPVIATEDPLVNAIAQANAAQAVLICQIRTDLLRMMQREGQP